MLPSIDPWPSGRTFLTRQLFARVFQMCTWDISVWQRNLTLRAASMRPRSRDLYIHVRALRWCRTDVLWHGTNREVPVCSNRKYNCCFIPVYVLRCFLFDRGWLRRVNKKEAYSRFLMQIEEAMRVSREHHHWHLGADAGADRLRYFVVHTSCCPR